MDPATEVVTVAPLTTRGVATLVAAGLGVEPEAGLRGGVLGGDGWHAVSGPHAGRGAARGAHRPGDVVGGQSAEHRHRDLGPLGDAAPGAPGSRRGRPGSGGGHSGAGRAGPGGPAGRAGTPRRGEGRRAAGAGWACWTRHRFVLSTPCYAPPSTGRSRSPSGPKRTGAPPGCWPKPTPARPGWPSTCWSPPRQATTGWSSSCGPPPGRPTATGAPESAAAYLRRALAEPPPPEVGADLLLELGVAEFSAGQPGWHDHLEEAVEAAGDDTTRIPAALVFAGALRMHERFAEAIEVCDRVAARPGDGEPEAHLVLEAMAVVCGLLDAATAPSVAKRAHAMVVEATRRPVPRPALAVAAYAAALTNQPADQVAELARRALAAGSSPRAGPPYWPPLLEPGESRWLSSAISALLWAERYGEAQALLDATVTEARTLSNEMLVLTLLVPRACAGPPAWRPHRRRGRCSSRAGGARPVRSAPACVRSRPAFWSKCWSNGAPTT